MQFTTSIAALIAAFSLLESANALCKPAVGIRVHNCRVKWCGIAGNCSYTPCHYITIYHGDNTATGGFEIGDAAKFGKGKQDQVYEWEFGGYSDQGGFMRSGFHPNVLPLALVERAAKLVL